MQYTWHFIIIITLTCFFLLLENKTTITMQLNLNSITSPIAKKNPKSLTIHNDERIDEYFWMRLSDAQKKAKNPDQQTTDVLNYLEAENKFLKHVMKDTDSLQMTLFSEIKSRIKKDDSSVPVKIGDYFYYSRYEKAKEYPLHCRKYQNLDNKETVLLDTPEMAKDFDYFSLGGQSLSSNSNLLMYGVDTVSRREYTLYIKNLESNKLLSDKIDGTTGSGVWANDNKTIFYTKQDTATLRSHRIYKHTLGTDQSQDILVYEEKDETFGCYVYKTKSKKYIIIGSYQTLSNEYRYVDANNPNDKFKIIHKREDNLEYSVYHFEDYFYILTNYKAKNFRLMKTKISNSNKLNWEPVIPHDKNILIEDIDIFKDYLVVEERFNGLNRIKVVKWNNLSYYYIDFKEEVYSLSAFANPEFNTSTLRLSYTSLTTPSTVLDFNMLTKDRIILKQTEVLDANFSIENYESKRLFAKSKDGIKIPISLVYRKGIEINGNNPVLLNGYGSYGLSYDVYFSSVRLSLLDRGFIYAIAHVRGGEELGRNWYEGGKLLNKKNTFNDFIDCADYLIDNNYTNNNKLYASGGSAGGLLMGAVINMRPKLFNGVIASVPFVDVLSTMLDESIPLTTGEFDEWGNPKNIEYYNYIKSYSPYDNIVKTDYPNLLIITGFWDSQVQYWEPAKWIAKLREFRTDDNILIMDCNMDVGHGGASGRFNKIKDIALEYAFLLKLEGLNKK